MLIFMLDIYLICTKSLVFFRTTKVHCVFCVDELPGHQGVHLSQHTSRSNISGPQKPAVHSWH